MEIQYQALSHTQEKQWMHSNFVFLGMMLEPRILRTTEVILLIFSLLTYSKNPRISKVIVTSPKQNVTLCANSCLCLQLFYNWLPPPQGRVWDMVLLEYLGPASHLASSYICPVSIWIIGVCYHACHIIHFTLNLVNKLPMLTKAQWAI